MFFEDYCFSRFMDDLKYYSKRAVKKLTDIKTIECTAVALAACSVVLAFGLIFTSKEEVGNGQGGFETPGYPAVTDSQVEVEAVNTDEYVSGISYQSYRVRRGDMIGIIAENFGITEDTIISVNNIRSSRLLQIGTYLKIPSIPGILYTVKSDSETTESISKKYEIDNAKLCAVNRLDSDASLKAGSMLFLPEAKLDRVTRQEINGDLFKKPIHARWYLSSRFGWRSSPFTGARSYHSGVDMACSPGTNIFAAMPGVVTSTGYNNVYGNYVIVSHHGGYKTLYGHMSAITTKPGKVVSFDSVIGKVGSTGMSTGPHLHFTVFKNGKQVNPQNLWN